MPPQQTTYNQLQGLAKEEEIKKGILSDIRRRESDQHLEIAQRNHLDTQENRQKKSKSGKFPIKSEEQVSSRSTAQKQYNYWIDVRDLHSMIKYCSTQIQQTQVVGQDAWDPDASISQSILVQNDEEQKGIYGENQCLSDKNTMIINQVAENDPIIKQVIKKYLQSFFQDQRGTSTFTIEDILQTNNGSKRVYLIENAKVITQVYQSKIRDDVKEALNDLSRLLQQYQDRYLNKTLRLCFSSQKELYSIFTKIFEQELFSNTTARKIFSLIYEVALGFRDHTQLLPTVLMNANFYLKVELYCRGRSLYDSSKSVYQLHKAVFDNNLPLISRLIKCQYEGVFYQEKNELDSTGHTPLELAVKIGHIDTIKVLCDLFTCPKLKSLPNSPCALDVASSIKNKDIIKILLEANQKIKQHYLDMHKDAMFKALEALPDFKIDMHFSCRSTFIPFLQNITPSDTYRIYKKGSQLRLDMTLVGFRHLKCIRGNLSVLFKGRGMENEGELFVVDHDTKSVTNIFSNVVNAKLDKDLEDIMSDSQYQKLYKADKFEMDPEFDKKKGEIVWKTIEGFKAEKYNLKTQFTMTKYKISVQEVQHLKAYQTYEEFVAHNQIDLAGTRNSEFEGINKDPLSATTPNPFVRRVDSAERARDGQILSTITSQNQEGSGSLNTIMGLATKNKKTTKKTINASIWLCKSHPLSLDSFLPLLQVLSFSSKQIAKFKDYLMKYQLPQGSFPLKAKIPIFFTMKATFSLQNLSFDPKNLPMSLFTIDEEYQRQRISNLISMSNQVEQNPKNQFKSEKHKQEKQADLNEIYKLFKTNEEQLDDENDDDDSIERANELYNSMLQKLNQSEELLLESFHSEQDSVDLSERHLNDEQFKLVTHAFTQIQTMNSINIRHEGDDLPTPALPNAKILAFIQAQEYKQMIEHKKKLKILQSKLPIQLESQPANYSSNITEGENLFDSKILDEKPKVNSTAAKRLITKMQKPPLKIGHNAISTPPTGLTLVVNSEDNVKTLKKTFQPKNFKNYKNMIKYNCNQKEFEDGVRPQQEETSFAGSTSTAQRSDNQSSTTPQRSTADNSIVTSKLLVRGFNEKTQESLGMNWFKQILDYKNAIIGKPNREGAGYLQTIESEEVVATEGCQNDTLSQNPHNQFLVNGGGVSSLMNRSSVLSQGNYEDSQNRKSIGSYSQIGKDDVSSKSYVEGVRRASGFGGNRMPSNDPLQFSREDKSLLMNHTALISKFHDYVVTKQNNIDGQTKSQQHLTITPSRSKQGNSIKQSPSPSQKIGPGSGNQSFDHKHGSFNGGSDCGENQLFSNRLAQSGYNAIEQKQNLTLLPPKISHKRQSSYGGSSSNASNYLGFIGPINNLAEASSKQGGAPLPPQPIGSGGIFGKFSGASNKPIPSGAPLGRQASLNKTSSQAQFTEAKHFMEAANSNQYSRQEALKNLTFANSQSIPQKNGLDHGNQQPKVLAQTLYGGQSQVGLQTLSKNYMIGVGQAQNTNPGLINQMTRSMNQLGSVGGGIGSLNHSNSLPMQRSTISIQKKKTSDADIFLSYQV